MLPSLRVLVVSSMVVAFLAPAATAQEPEPRKIAPVVHIGGASLFDVDGSASKVAERTVDEMRRAIEPLRSSSFTDIPFALAVFGRTCDELMLSSDPDARRVLDTLRELAKNRPVLATPYTRARIDPFGQAKLGAEIGEGAKVVEACVGKPSNDVLVSRELVLPGADGLEMLRKTGVRRALSGAAVVDTQRESRPGIVPAMTMEIRTRSADVAAARPEAPSLAVLVSTADQLAELAGESRLALTTLEKLGDIDVLQGLIPSRVEVSRRARNAVEDATDAFETLKAVTLPQARLTAIFRAQLSLGEELAQGVGGARGTANVALDLEEQIQEQLGLWSVADGSVTFTSRSGSIPVTVSNDAAYPVRLRVTASSPKLDFPSGRSRVVTIEPPGEAITFASIARSTGTFPVTVTLRSPDRQVSFDTAELTVRSTGANLLALALTAGGALFLMAWIGRRVKRGSARRPPPGRGSAGGPPPGKGPA